MKVLIAEDESIIRMDLEEALRGHGHEVVASVASGDEALKMAREKRPDVAVLDVRMPGMDGIKVAQLLAKERICSSVILTAYSDKKMVEAAAKAGVASYLVKPFRPEELNPAILLARARFEELSRLSGEVDDLRGDLEARKVVERAKGVLMKRLGIPEEQAYSMMRKRAMDERVPLAEIARRVLE